MDAAKEKKEEEMGLVESDHSEDSEILDEDDSGVEAELQFQEPLTEKELEELLADLLEVESKAAEAQEALEEESLVKVEADVKKELAQSLSGDELEKAVVEEMSTLKEEWEVTLDELETESAYLLEQLDGAGIELSSLYKWIERQVPTGCCTEAWKKRSHWVGTHMSLDATESVAKAEEYLKIHRPVRRRHGKILEEGASGFLGKTIAKCDSSVAANGTIDIDWDSFSKICSEWSSSEKVTFGSKYWASVYLASTPQQAAELGLKFAGVDEVEEIDDVDGTSSDPFVAAAIANENDLSLTEDQKRKFRKIKEEDDANDDLKIRMKWRRCRKQNKQGELFSIDELQENQKDVNMTLEDGTVGDDNEYNKQTNSIHVLSSDSDEEKAMPEIVIVCSSDSDSNDSDADTNVSASSKRRKKKRIRRILDDAELGEETKKKIAIEKERQERLKSLVGQYATKSVMVNDGLSFDASRVEISSGYIINLLREDGEEAVRIPPSISDKLKPHQVGGIQFMWENIIQSVRKVKSGDRGLGCILAHTMGLGKTLQVIAFLYTVMRSVDLGLKTALIVTPVTVLHNWRHEFLKWRPYELKPLQIFILDDVTSEERLELLTNWRTKGGVFLIGYSAFRNLSLGNSCKDLDVAMKITRALQDGPDILFCDEAHIIKNTKADTTKALKQVKCQRRIALTGSPLQNNLMEYYCMVDFVREGYLGSRHEFRNRFQNPIEHGQHTNSTAEDVKLMNQRSHILYQQLKGFVQRMDTSVVKYDLPPKTVYVITVKLSSLQRKLYKRFLDVHEDKASGQKSFFAGYQTLAQIWNHPGILQLMKGNKDPGKYEHLENCCADENVNCNVISGEKQQNLHKRTDEEWWRDLPENNYNDVDSSGKMVLLLDILTMCSDIGDKALVFSQSLLTLDLIELHLSKFTCQRKSGKCWEKGKDWYRLDGKTESSERQKMVERFNDPLNKRVKCILLSTRAGSLGVNLYAANRVIIVDGSWNPTYDLQAIFRVWRYGQTKPVFAYRLLAHATMEEKIYKRQVTKEGLAARVVDRKQVHRTISKEEMLDLFGFGDDENADLVHGLGKEHAVDNPNTAGSVQKFLKQGQPPLPETSSDKVFQSLISRHHPSWISSYHEHESLLQENEDEKLSKEEKDLAWEVYRRTFMLETSQPVPPNDTNLDQHKLSAPSIIRKLNQKTIVPISAAPSPIRQQQQAPPAIRQQQQVPSAIRQQQQVPPAITHQQQQQQVIVPKSAPSHKPVCSTAEAPQNKLSANPSTVRQQQQQYQKATVPKSAAPSSIRQHQAPPTIRQQQRQHQAPPAIRQQQVIIPKSAPSHKPVSTSEDPQKSDNKRLRICKCTNLAHLLTLQSQGTKKGCSTICGECAKELRWEDHNLNANR